MNTSTEKAHAQAIEKRRIALNEAVEAAIKDGLHVDVSALPLTLDGQTFEKAHIRMVTFRRIEP